MKELDELFIWPKLIEEIEFGFGDKKKSKTKTTKDVDVQSSILAQTIES